MESRRQGTGRVSCGGPVIPLLAGTLVLVVLLRLFSACACGSMADSFQPVELLASWMGLAGVVSALCLAVPGPLGRLAVIALAWAAAGAFYLANSLYFRYYRDFLPFHALFETAALSEVWDAVYGLLHPVDLLGFVVVPAVSWLILRRFEPGRPPVWLPLSCLAAFAVLVAIMGGEVRDPALVFLYDMKSAVTERPGGSEGWFERLAARRERLFPLHDSRYEYAPLDRGVFLQRPRPGLSDFRPRFPGGPEKPNVVLVVLESFRAFESGAYGAEPSFTPRLDRLAESSLLFTRCYANGFQTVRGEFSLLASLYPNVAGGPHYIHHPRVKLRSLPEILKEMGYHTSWICGIGREFERHGDFLLSHGIDEIVDRHVLPSEPVIGMGLADHALFEEVVRRLSSTKEPFFSEVLSLSNHYPFHHYPTDGQAPAVAPGEEPVYARYARGIYYTDYSIGRFMELARKTSWYERTIFVFVADHGLYIFPKSLMYSRIRQQEAAFRIPMLIHAAWIPPARIDVPAGQVDLAPTLMDIMGYGPEHTFLGRSLLDGGSGPKRRIVMMCQQRNWFMRVDDTYLYCGLPMPGKSARMQYMAGYDTVFDLRQRSLAFSTGVDLLRRLPRQVRVVDPAAALAARRAGRDALDLCKLAVVNDRVYVPVRGRKGNRPTPGGSGRGFLLVADCREGASAAAVRALRAGADRVLLPSPAVLAPLLDGLEELRRNFRVRRALVSVSSVSDLDALSSLERELGLDDGSTAVYCDGACVPVDRLRRPFFMAANSATTVPAPPGNGGWKGMERCLGLVAAPGTGHDLMRSLQNRGFRVLAGGVELGMDLEDALFLGFDGAVTSRPAMMAGLLGKRRTIRYGRTRPLGTLFPLSDGRILELRDARTGAWSMWRYEPAGKWSALRAPGRRGVPGFGIQPEWAMPDGIDPATRLAAIGRGLILVRKGFSGEVDDESALSQVAGSGRAAGSGHSAGRIAGGGKMQDGGGARKPAVDGGEEAQDLVRAGIWRGPRCRVLDFQWNCHPRSRLVTMSDGAVLEYLPESGRWWLWRYDPGSGLDKVSSGRWSEHAGSLAIGPAREWFLSVDAGTGRFCLRKYFPRNEHDYFSEAPYSEGTIDLHGMSSLAALPDGAVLLYQPGRGRYEIRPRFP